jgi:hypothetical protein
MARGQSGHFPSAGEPPAAASRREPPTTVLPPRAGPMLSLPARPVKARTRAEPAIHTGRIARSGITPMGKAGEARAMPQR